MPRSNGPPGVAGSASANRDTQIRSNATVSVGGRLP
jgi:hypothetical protein